MARKSAIDTVDYPANRTDWRVITNSAGDKTEPEGKTEGLKWSKQHLAEQAEYLEYDPTVFNKTIAF